MRLNHRQQANDRRRSSILNDRINPPSADDMSNEMQKAIVETRRRIAEAFADGKKIRAVLRSTNESR